jgi:hypothetical protein
MRHESSGERDLSINLWHRATFGDDAKALDVDLIGMCGRCDQPLYAYEATRSQGYKATKWLRQICLQQNVPGYLVVYSTTEPERCPHCGRPQVSTKYDPDRITRSHVSLEVPFQSRRHIGDLGDLEEHLIDLRSSHQRIWHAEHRQSLPTYTVEDQNALLDEMRATDEYEAYIDNGAYGHSEAPF